MSERTVRRGGVWSVLFGTLAGRSIVIGVIARLAAALAAMVIGRETAWLGVVDTVAAVAIAAGGLYLIVTGVSLLWRRLLWRVSRKLIISYIFIGFIPAILLLAFFVLSVVLLFYNFSAYMMRREVRELAIRVDAVAKLAAAEIERGGGRDVGGTLQKREAEAAREFPDVSMAVVRVDRPCNGRTSSADEPIEQPNRTVTAGPWGLVDPPRRIPDWIDCSGFRGLLAASAATASLADRPVAGGVAESVGRVSLVSAPDDTRLIVRAVAFPSSPVPGYAVVVDLVVNRALTAQVRETIGVQLDSVSDVSRTVGLAHTRATYADRSAPESAAAQGWRPSFAFLEYHEWETGEPGTLQVAIRLGLGEIYNRISAAPGLDNTRNIVIILLELVGGLFLIIEMIALATGFALARSITGSVHELFTGTERVRHGDFTHKIATTADDQLGELAGAFNSMTASIEDLLLQAAEKKRLEEELRIAHEIQMSLLPQGPLSVPGLSVAALCVPAREVGGDYYDMIRLDDHRIGVLIADVSGKGTSAALYMAELKGLMLSLSKIYTSPRELLIQANRLIAEHLDARSFITMTYAVVDLRAGTMTYARAGHTPLVYLPGPKTADAGPRFARILVPDGLVLGLKIDHGETFERLLEEDTIRLRPGDLYVFFTDGITEAMNPADDCFGDLRLGQVIEQHADLPLEELRERVLREIEAFVAGAPQHDDMTLILLKVNDPYALGPSLDVEQIAGAARD